MFKVAYTYLQQTKARMQMKSSTMQARMMAITHCVPQNPNTEYELSQKRRESGKVNCARSMLHLLATRSSALQPAVGPTRPRQSSSSSSLAWSVPGGGHGKLSHRSIGSRMQSGAVRHRSHFWQRGQTSVSMLPITAATVHREICNQKTEEQSLPIVSESSNYDCTHWGHSSSLSMNGF